MQGEDIPDDFLAKMGPLLGNLILALQYYVRVLCTFTVYGVLFFPPAAETCARLAGNFCQYLTTVKSGANCMVWVNV